MEMKIDDIQRYLPHRYPFLLIDRVTDLQPGRHIHCYKNISFNEWYFPGHFPNKPIFPGVLTLEAMAQSSGLLGFRTMNIEPKESSIYIFVGVDKLRFRHPVEPGDRLDLYSEIIKNKRNMWRFFCRASVGDTMICSAEILCAHQQIDQDD